MKYYWISVRTKEQGFLIPFLTDSEHLEEAYKYAQSIGEYVSVHNLKLDKETNSYVLGTVVNI